MLSRLLTLIIKELRTILRNRESRTMIITPVVLQLAIFPFAATLEISNAKIGIYNEDGGKHSIELIQRLAQAENFPRAAAIWDDHGLERAITNQNVLLAVRFSPDFSRALDQGGNAPVQVVLDGRRSNGGQIALTYIQSILSQYQEELAQERGFGQISSYPEFRNWYNPNLDYKWFVLPSLVALITQLGVLVFTGLSLAREQEQGTLEQLLVSPLSTWQIFAGKAVPTVIIALFQASIILFAAIFLYRIPFSGALPLFYGAMMVYALSLTSVGLFISALCSTQQQAYIAIVLFGTPTILLSGLISPVENMPVWLQHGNIFNPIRQFVEITKKIYLKGAGFSAIWENMYPMLIVTVCTLIVAYFMFRRKTA